MSVVQLMGIMTRLMVVTWNERRLSVSKANRRRLKRVVEKVSNER